MRIARLILSSAFLLSAALAAFAQHDSAIAVYDLEQLPPDEGVSVDRNLPGEMEEGLRPGEGEMEELPRPPEGAPPAKQPPDAAMPDLPADAMPPTPPKQFTAVKLQGLNKVTARSSTFETPLGTLSQFGNLEIIARRCWQAPPEEQPENAALLEIREIKPGEAPQTVFNGWMFSSSPGLSALEHPVYDITVIECTMAGEEP